MAQAYRTKWVPAKNCETEPEKLLEGGLPPKEQRKIWRESEKVRQKRPTGYVPPPVTAYDVPVRNKIMGKMTEKDNDWVEEIEETRWAAEGCLYQRKFFPVCGHYGKFQFTPCVHRNLADPSSRVYSGKTLPSLPLIRTLIPPPFVEGDCGCRTPMEYLDVETAGLCDLCDWWDLTLKNFDHIPKYDWDLEEFNHITGQYHVHVPMKQIPYNSPDGPSTYTYQRR